MRTHRSLTAHVRQAIQDGERRDAGAAMVMVLGVMMVGALLTTTLAYAVMYNSQRTIESRLQLRAVASADAGLDMVMQMFEGTTYADLTNPSTRICGRSFVYSDDAVVITTSYRVTRGVDPNSFPVACPQPGDVVKSAVVTSTATYADVPISGDTINQTVQAVFAPTPPKTVLDKAIFSEGTAQLTNGTKLVASGNDASGNSLDDANVYANGGIKCETQESIAGKVIAAHGDVTLTNGCKLYSSVWASGSVQSSASGALIDGDVYAASTDANNAFKLAGTTLVTGSVLTNGGVSLNNANAPTGGVGGTVFSGGGTITLIGDSTIGGSAYASKTIDLGSGGSGGKVSYDALSQTGNITGSPGHVLGHAWALGTISSGVTAATKTMGTSYNFPTTPNPARNYPAEVGYPGTIGAPPREQMPKITMNPDDITLWEGQNWVRETYTGQCSASEVSNVINNGSWISPRLIIFTGCPSNVTINNSTFILKNNIALISRTGFNLVNDVWMKTDNPAQPRKAFFIVPADSPGVSWNPVPNYSQTSPSCAPSRDISVMKLGVVGVSTMFYTPCTVKISNGNIGGSDVMSGQIYGGTVNLPNQITMRMESIPVPSLADSEPSPTSPTEMRVTSRYDVRG